MKLNIENTPVDVPCPACGNKAQVAFSEIKNKDQIVCSACGISIRLEFKDAPEAIIAAENAVAKLASDLGKLNKK